MIDNKFEEPLDDKPENMEVHHHVHDQKESHHKKDWKSYFWEFLMLFLAVFCGFIAEWQLEHVIENSREKEFIKSMIEDAQIDISNIERVSKNNKKVLLYVDSLATACYDYELGKSDDYEIYRLYRHLLAAAEALKPTERTLLQLTNSGGMRLIRNKPSVAKIIFYDGVGKDIRSQQEVVYKFKYEFANASFDLFNYKYFNMGKQVGVSHDAKLLSQDKIKLIQFANRIAIYDGVLNKYNLDLNGMNESAIKLINTLEKEYQLTEK